MTDGFVAILSTDRRFAEMLMAEFTFLRISARIAETAEAAKGASLVLLDLDTVHTPPKDFGGRMIGFTKSAALSPHHAGRECTIILRRPFELRLLRREVAALLTDPQDREASLSDERRVASSSRPALILDRTRGVLSYGETVIPLGPNEAAIMDCLLAHRGEPVSRELLAERIGRSDANKLEVYICYLRRKMRVLPEGERIVTVRKQGYMMP